MRGKGNIFVSKTDAWVKGEEETPGRDGACPTKNVALPTGTGWHGAAVSEGGESHDHEKRPLKPRGRRI